MDNSDLEGLKTATVIDARWLPCPGPLLKAKQAMPHVKPGEVMEIRSHDPGARRDISAWAAKVGHEFLGFLCSEGCDRIFVMKRTS